MSNSHQNYLDWLYDNDPDRWAVEKKRTEKFFEKEELKKPNGHNF